MRDQMTETLVDHIRRRQAENIQEKSRNSSVDRVFSFVFPRGGAVPGRKNPAIFEGSKRPYPRDEALTPDVATQPAARPVRLGSNAMRNRPVADITGHAVAGPRERLRALRSAREKSLNDRCMWYVAVGDPEQAPSGSPTSGSSNHGESPLRQDSRRRGRLRTRDSDRSSTNGPSTTLGACTTSQPSRCLPGEGLSTSRARAPLTSLTNYGDCRRKRPRVSADRTIGEDRAPYASAQSPGGGRGLPPRVGDAVDLRPPHRPTIV